MVAIVQQRIGLIILRQSEIGVGIVNMVLSGLLLHAGLKRGYELVGSGRRDVKAQKTHPVVL